MARPSKLPRWATTGIKVEPTETKKDQGWLTSEKPPAQYDNWFKDLASQWISYFDSIPDSVLFGPGTDGDATIAAGTTTLTKDMFYNNLAVEATGILETANYRVYVKDTLTIDSAGGGRIQNNGSAGAAGGAGGASTVEGTFRATSAGGAGGVAAGSTGTSAAGKTGGAAGAGGAGSGGGGGAGGASAGAISPLEGSPYSPFCVQNGYLLGQSGGTILNGFLGSSAGGGGGGGDGTAGGGGGAGGGFCFVIARTVVDTVGTGISAKGGNGGTPAAGNRGGGGGGAGGVVFHVYHAKTGAAITAASTAGGTGGTGSGTGISGASGTAGTFYEIDLGLGASASGTGIHEESGVGAMSDVGAGDGVDYLDAVFSEAFSATDYEFEFSAYSTLGFVIPLSLTQKTTTYMRITPSAPFVGEISWSARKK